MRLSSNPNITLGAPKPQSTALNHYEAGLPLAEDLDGRRKLDDLMAISFDTLRLFGKEPEALANTVRMFQMVLADYSIGQIENAFRVYFKRSSDFPAPADIAQIIDRGGKPPLERAVYVSISKKQPFDRSAEEWEYMNEYENYMISG